MRGEGGDEGEILAMIAWDVASRPLVMGRPAIEPRQGGMGTAFIHEHQLLRGIRRDIGPPCRTHLFIPFACCQRFFYASNPTAAWPATSSVH